MGTMRISLLQYLLRQGSYILRILRGTYCEGITSNQLCSLFSVIYICRVYTQYYYVLLRTTTTIITAHLKNTNN